VEAAGGRNDQWRRIGADYCVLDDWFVNSLNRSQNFTGGCRVVVVKLISCLMAAVNWS
jgi:hypothetical protein